MKDPNRLVTPDGGFQSEFPGGKNKNYSIGYLEDLCEWVYHHDNMTNKQKLKTILKIEKIIAKMVKRIVKNCNYIPTWSTKLKENE